MQVSRRRCHSQWDSEEQLIRDVETINKNVQVLDEKGEDMCYRFDAQEHFKN